VDDDGGRKRPDALVHLPGDRVVVVDAKCSLTAYAEAMRLEGDARDAALDAHVASVRAHVRGLAGKRYPDAVRGRALELVFLFVPSDPAFHAAIARDPELYADAFRERVVLASPTTLLAALHLVDHLWRSEHQNANARRIAEEAGRLLEKLAAFVGDLDDVGARLAQAQASWSDARAKLATGRGNVLRKAGEVARLGARVRPGTREALEALAGEEAEDGGEPRARGVPAA
jgi:DNA recombination protein RmuC